ncbi:MAG: arylesterase [Myxococcota bacterium]|nr:arylesterase [Myxococcota bacterium]
MPGEPVRMVVLGDSLTAGYGLKPSEAFPAQLERALVGRGANVKVANAGVSGDTASGGAARLAWAIADGPHVVIVELGANDGLRAIEPDVTYQKLDEILTALEGQGIAVLFTGMMMPPNFGDYGKRFAQTFERLAKAHPGAVYYPFFLEGVARDPKLSLPDGMHPNAEGVRHIVERIMPSVEKVLARAR